MAPIPLPSVEAVDEGGLDFSSPGGPYDPELIRRTQTQ